MKKDAKNTNVVVCTSAVHYVWLSEFWSHFCGTMYCLPQRLKSMVFKKIQTTLILVFEVIVQPPKHIFWHFHVRPKSWKSHTVEMFMRKIDLWSFFMSGKKYLGTYTSSNFNFIYIFQVHKSYMWPNQSIQHSINSILWIGELWIKGKIPMGYSSWWLQRQDQNRCP